MVFKRKPKYYLVDRRKCLRPGEEYLGEGVKWLSFGYGDDAKQIIGLNTTDFDNFLSYIADDFATEETERKLYPSDNCRYLDRDTIYQFYRFHNYSDNRKNGLQYLTEQVSPMFKRCWDHQVKDGSIQMLVDKDDNYMDDGIINHIKDVKYIHEEGFNHLSQEDKVRQVRKDAKNDYARMFWTKDYEKEWRNRDENRQETIIDYYGSNVIGEEGSKQLVRIRRMYPIEFAIKYGRLEYYKEAIMATFYCLIKIFNDMSANADRKAKEMTNKARKAKYLAESKDLHKSMDKYQAKFNAKLKANEANQYEKAAAEYAAPEYVPRAKHAAEQINKFPNDMPEGGVMSITTDDWENFKNKKKKEEDKEINAQGGKRRNSRKTMKSKTAKKSNKSKRKSRKYHRK